MRAALEARRLQEAELGAAQLRAENAQRRLSLAEAGAQGRDGKSLSEATLAAWRALEEQREAQHATEMAALAEDNAVMKACLAAATGKDRKGLSFQVLPPRGGSSA